VSHIAVEGLSKLFPRYHADRAWTLQEIFQRGWGAAQPADFFLALDDVSFRVEPGRMVGIVGLNGAGKSTLLRLVAGVGRPHKGSVEIEGRVGAILDLGVGFHPELTGRENVFISGITSGLTRREVEARFDSIVAFSELEDFLDNPLRTFSTGMQMRLAFAVASHIEPEVLLIDEVLAVGDLPFQLKCFARLSRFKENGCTGLVVSHTPEHLTALCDEAIWLHEGKLVLHDETRVVLDRYIEVTTSREGVPVQSTGEA
jgi:lipopolysaccharide transport system ATP-binding protein